MSSTGSSQTVHCLFLSSSIFFSFVTLILSSVIVSLEIRSTSPSKQDQYHPATMEVMVTSIFSLIYLAGLLAIWKLESKFDFSETRILDGWRKFGFVVCSEIVLISLFLGGSAPLVLQSDPQLKTTGAFGLISLLLIFFHFAFLLVYFCGLFIALPPNQDESKSLSLRRVFSLPMHQLLGQGKSPLDDTDCERGIQSESSNTSSNRPEKTYIPPSSTAWPSSSTSNVNIVSSSEAPLRNVSLQPPTPSYNPLNYQPRRPLRKPDEDIGESSQWSNRNADKRYQEEFRLKNERSRGMKRLRDEGLLNMNTSEFYQVQQNQATPPSTVGKKPSEIFSTSPSSFADQSLPPSQAPSSSTRTSPVVNRPAHLNLSPAPSNLIPPLYTTTTSPSAYEEPLPSSVPTFISATTALVNQPDFFSRNNLHSKTVASWVEIKTQEERRGIAFTRPMMKAIDATVDVRNNANADRSNSLKRLMGRKVSK